MADHYQRTGVSIFVDHDGLELHQVVDPCNLLINQNKHPHYMKTDNREICAYFSKIFGCGVLRVSSVNPALSFSV